MLERHSPDKPLTQGEEQLAKGLGWFSLALGAAEILAPNALARFIGVRPRPALFISLGLREILSGIGILSQKRPTGWLWSRVAGDMMDLSLLGAALTSRHSDKMKVEAAAGAVLGVTAADILSALQHSRIGQPVHVSHTIAIDRPAAEVYQFWRRLENLPRFMRYLESVETYGENRSRWVARLSTGKRIEWDAELTAEIPNQLISWRSLAGAEIKNAGSVTFQSAPADRGCFLRVDVTYEPPGGFFGAAVARLFGQEPEQLLRAGLRRFKAMIETTSEPSPESSLEFDPSIPSSIG